MFQIDILLHSIFVVCVFVAFFCSYGCLILFMFSRIHNVRYYTHCVWLILFHLNINSKHPQWMTNFRIVQIYITQCVNVAVYVIYSNIVYRVVLCCILFDLSYWLCLEYDNEGAKERVHRSAWTNGVISNYKNSNNNKNRCHAFGYVSNEWLHFVSNSTTLSWVCQIQNLSHL